MGHGTDNEDPPRPAIDACSAEIKDLVREGAIRHALRRLQDFADVFGNRELRNETVQLQARWSSLAKEIRGRVAEHAERRQGEITRDLVALVDVIHDASMEREFRAQAAHPQDGATPPGDAGTSTRPKRVNRLEQARADFRATRSARHAHPDAVFSCHRLGKHLGGFELRNVDLQLRPGEITGVVGVNGSGKTTLLRMIAGELAPTAGEIEYPAICPRRLDWSVLSRRIAYVRQSPPKWYGRVKESLHLLAAEHGLRGELNAEEVDFILYRLGLHDYATHRWHEISSGYKMRFELARALLTRPQLLVLDEPLAPLDIITQQIVLSDIRDLAESRRIAVILSSQHLHEVEAIADRLLVFAAGEPVFNDRVEHLGKDEPDNVFELVARSTNGPLEPALDALPGFLLERFGGGYVLKVDRHVSASQVLERLLSAGIVVTHFRDVTTSSRRFFETRNEDL